MFTYIWHGSLSRLVYPSSVAADPDLGSWELHSYRRWRGSATADLSCAARRARCTKRRVTRTQSTAKRPVQCCRRGRPSERAIAHARRPRCYRAQARLHCRTGPRAHTRRDDPPAEAVRPLARDFFPSFNVSMSSDSPRPPEVVTESEATCAVHAIPSWVRLGFLTLVPPPLPPLRRSAVNHRW